MSQLSGFKPSIIAVDVETKDDDGPSLEFWRRDFRVISMAASWAGADGQIVSDYMLGETAVEHFLERVSKAGIPLMAHNLQFEAGVFKCRFPHIRVNLAVDTMRLVQVMDNGGDKFALEKPLTLDDQLDVLEGESDDERQPESIAGLGLGKAVRRVLSEPSHKERYYRWLRDNVADCKRGREGQFLDRLPPDQLRAYNVGDTEACLKLYVHLVEYFASISYNWTLDHQLYLSSVRYLVDAKIRGVRVERDKLESYRGDLEREIEAIGAEFRSRFAEPIERVERSRLLLQVKKRKTLRGRKCFVRDYRSGKRTNRKLVVFNVGSNDQLAALFCGEMAMVAKFETATGRPSFRSAVLGQWQEGGEMLKTRRKRMLVLKQCEALLELSKVDGRWHCDLKAAGTSTGRFSGGQHA